MSEITFLQENLYIIYGIVSCIILAILIMSAAKNRGKMEIMIQTPGGEYRLWRKKEKDGKTVIIEKEKGKKQPGWTIEIKDARSIKNKKRFFGLISYQSVDIYPDAKEPMIFDSAIKPEEQPKWNKKLSKEFVEVEVLKKAGKPEEKGKSSMGLLILGVLLVINLILTFLSLSGSHIKIG